jgi:hypothetical protein
MCHSVSTTSSRKAGFNNNFSRMVIRGKLHFHLNTGAISHIDYMLSNIQVRSWLYEDRLLIPTQRNHERYCHHADCFRLISFHSEAAYIGFGLA